MRRLAALALSAALLAAGPAAAQADFHGSLGLDVIAPGTGLSLGVDAPKYRFAGGIDPSLRLILPLTAFGPEGLAIGGRSVLREPTQPNQEFSQAGLASVALTANAELVGRLDSVALRGGLGIQDTLGNGLQLRGGLAARVGDDIGLGVRLGVASPL